MLAVLLRCTLYFELFDQWKITHYVLSTLLCWFGLHFSSDKWFNQTHYVSYFTKKYGLFRDLTSGKIRHYVFASFVSSFGVHLVIEELLNQTPFVRYFTNIHLVCFVISLVHKSDTMWYIIYCVDCSYIMSLKSDLIRHSVLAVSLRFVRFFCVILPVKLAYNMC